MKTVTCINVARETGHAVLSLDGAEYAVSLDDLQKILADIAGPRPVPATELLRPSLLPKLAQCPCYVSSPTRGKRPGGEPGWTPPSGPCSWAWTNSGRVNT